MTLQEILDQLSKYPSESELVFSAEGADISGGYHLTEFKLARIASIDCGARTSTWTEASMQLLDGHGGEFITLDKFMSIAKKSIEMVADLGSAPLNVEFAPGNEGIRIYDLQAPTFAGNRVTVNLVAKSAACKPSQEFAARFADAEIEPAANSSCCGPTQQTSCCG